MTDANSTRTVTYATIARYVGYRFGDDGSIQTCMERVKGGRRGQKAPTGPWRSKKPGRDVSGHFHVTLRNRDTRKLDQLKVHRLILEAFVGPCPAGMMCCHNNGNPADNRLCNLRWDTAKANNADKIAHGTWQGGERNGNAKLTANQVESIRRRRSAGEKRVALAREFGVTPEMIYLIVSGKNWAGPKSIPIR